MMAGTMMVPKPTGAAAPGAIRDALEAAFIEDRDCIRRVLLARGLETALQAMEFAGRFHTGLRKSGAPEFSHQVAIADMLLDMDRAGPLPELDATLAVAFLHDLREDYGILDDTIRLRFGELVADAVDCLTKVERGRKRGYGAIATSAIALIVKGCDRRHNLETLGPFAPAKRVEYRRETRDEILPLFEGQPPCRERAGVFRRLGEILAGLAAEPAAASGF